MDGNPNVRGAIKGSFPVDGGYNKYCYLNWACKFFIDSNLLEMSIREVNRGCKNSNLLCSKIQHVGAFN